MSQSNNIDDLGKLFASLDNAGKLVANDYSNHVWDYSNSYDPFAPVSNSSISPLTTTSLAALTTNQITALTSASLSTWTLPQNSTGVYTISAGGTGGGGITTSANISVNGTGYNNIWSNDYANGIKIKGDAELDGDLKIKGESISDLLKNIQDKLAIFKPNPELEEKWEKLRDLARQYKELETDIKEKELIWKTLQK